MKVLDFFTFKDFRLCQRASLQSRTEIFNILNHPNCGMPAVPWALKLLSGMET